MRFQVIACLCLCLSAGVGAVSAQVVGLRIEVPFAFNVAEKLLPAGQYVILAPNGGQTLRVFGPNRSAALALTNQVTGTRPTGPGAVVFKCYGPRCFLSRFWAARTETGQELLTSPLEKQLAHQRQLVAVTLKAKL